MTAMKQIPPPPWTLDHAHKEIMQVAKWARQMGYTNIAPRLDFAGRLIKEEINKTANSPGQSVPQEK